jgi:hypothetical protein
LEDQPTCSSTARRKVRLLLLREARRAGTTLEWCAENLEMRSMKRRMTTKEMLTARKFG